MMGWMALFEGQQELVYSKSRTYTFVLALVPGNPVSAN